MKIEGCHRKDIPAEYSRKGESTETAAVAFVLLSFYQRWPQQRTPLSQKHLLPRSTRRHFAEAALRCRVDPPSSHVLTLHTQRYQLRIPLGMNRKAGSRRGLSLRSGFGLRAIHRITTQISRTLLERTLCIGCPSLLCDLLPGAAGLGTSQSIPPRPTKGGRRVHTLFEKTTCLSSQPCGMTFETFARRARCAVAVDPSS